MSDKERGRRNTKTAKAIIKYCPKCREKGSREEMIRFQNLSYECPECQKKVCKIKTPWIYMCPVCQYLEGSEE